MNKCMRTIWGICGLVVIIALTLGVVLPPIISSNVFPAWLIVVTCGGILGVVASLSIIFMHFIRR